MQKNIFSLGSPRHSSSLHVRLEKEGQVEHFALWDTVSKNNIVVEQALYLVS